MSIIIDASQQVLQLCRDDVCLSIYPVSTARNGLGEQKNSFKTPRGLHQIRAKIGAGQPVNTIFRGRRTTGKVYDASCDSKHDWILTRILWLSGLEVGMNRLGDVDTMQRYIYIHGTGDEAHIGQPVSCGCIRMRNQDILELFEQVNVGDLVLIK